MAAGRRPADLTSVYRRCRCRGVGLSQRQCALRRFDHSLQTSVHNVDTVGPYTTTAGVGVDYDPAYTVHGPPPRHPDGGCCPSSELRIMGYLRWSKTSTGSGGVVGSAANAMVHNVDGFMGYMNVFKSWTWSPNPANSSTNGYPISPPATRDNGTLITDSNYFGVLECGSGPAPDRY